MEITDTASLREKEVINLCGGEKLGYPSEFGVDLDSRQLVSITVPVGGLFAFPGGEKLVIPWCRIECVGEDTILVNLPKEAYDGCLITGKEKKKKKKC